MTALAGNHAHAQAINSALPDAADGLVYMAPVAAPPLQFTDATGNKLSLSDYKGHVLVVNSWATWCGPCVRELPTLAALAAQIRPSGGLVLPISIDTDGPQVVPAYFAQHSITNLPVLLDPDGFNLQILNTNGVPVTLIIDPQGRLVARLDGGADWNTPRVKAFIKTLALAPPQGKPANTTL